MVASNKVGLVIGKGGETIKSINQASGAHVEIDRNAPPEATEKNFIIKGSAEAVDRAKSMVLEKIGAIEVFIDEFFCPLLLTQSIEGFWLRSFPRSDLHP